MLQRRKLELRPKQRLLDKLLQLKKLLWRQSL
jgi:hypothetical protein